MQLNVKYKAGMIRGLKRVDHYPISLIYQREIE